MMLFSHWLFWMKNWRFSANSCEGFIVSLRLHLSNCFCLKLCLTRLWSYKNTSFTWNVNIAVMLRLMIVVNFYIRNFNFWFFHDFLVLNITCFAVVSVPLVTLVIVSNHLLILLPPNSGKFSHFINLENIRKPEVF